MKHMEATDLVSRIRKNIESTYHGVEAFVINILVATEEMTQTLYTI